LHFRSAGFKSPTYHAADASTSDRIALNSRRQHVSVPLQYYLFRRRLACPLMIRAMESSQPAFLLSASLTAAHHLSPSLTILPHRSLAP
ncbi:hypothetical protein CLOM_g12769, partial [Closterium sp. NIES-68]